MIDWEREMTTTFPLGVGALVEIEGATGTVSEEVTDALSSLVALLEAIRMHRPFGVDSGGGVLSSLTAAEAIEVVVREAQLLQELVGAGTIDVEIRNHAKRLRVLLWPS